MRFNINSLKPVYLLLAAFLWFGSAGYAPGHTEEYQREMLEIEPWLVALNNYVGYQHLLSQISSDEALDVIRIIEGSSYPDLVKAIIEVESSWRVDARSSMDARGLMQVRLIAARDIDPGISPDDLFDPVTNVRLGVQIFENHMAYFSPFSATVHWALTAYNRGRKGTFDLKCYPPRTRYSNKVLGGANV